MMYYVNWVLTNAQLELLAADVSVVDYNFDKKKRKRGEYDDTSANSESIAKANKEWLDKYGDGEDAGKGLSIGDVLGNGLKTETGVKIK